MRHQAPSTCLSDTSSRVGFTDVSCMCRGGKLYLQASGWRVAKKDRIDLDITRLADAQGLYTCPPLEEGDKPFSCCLEVKEDMQVTRQVRPSTPAQCRFLQKSISFGRKACCLCGPARSMPE